jgi:predicted RNA-binding Zn ribbon-like protein
MPTPVKNQTLFDLSGGHPALDLVNSLDNRFRADGPNENLVRYSDLLRFLNETGLLDSQKIRLLDQSASHTATTADLVLRQVKELREATAEVFYAAMEERTPPPAAIKTLEGYFRGAATHRALQWDNQHNHTIWTWNATAATDPNFPLWLLTQSVSDILLSPDAARVKTCAVDTCRWLFLDTSKNHTRRWCNMKVCGNRMKARRFQARHEG